MILTEYRIPFPATVDEYRVGMLYMIARASAEEARRAGRKVAVEVLRNEPYTHNEHGLAPGIYTEKVFHIRNLLPRFLRAFVPPSSAQVIEKSWAAYPNRCLTQYYWPYLSTEKSVMTVESRYLPDRGETDNALALSDEEVDTRQVVMLDIASEDHLRMSSDADVRKFRSTRAEGRGALQPGVWVRNAAPVMCCYKLCRVDIAQPRIEQWGQRLMQSSFIHYNRQALVWMDSWFGMSFDEVSGIPSVKVAKPPLPPEKTRTMVATELATEALGLASLSVFAHADATDPFS